MNKSDKRRTDKSGIDEKAILEMVRRKGSMLSLLSEPVPSPKGPESARKEPAGEENTGQENAGEKNREFTDGQLEAFTALFLDGRKNTYEVTLHITEEMHQCILALIWGIGGRKATVAGVANRMLELAFEHYRGLVDSVIKKRYESLKGK